MSFVLCPFKNFNEIFGRLNEGLHSYRFLNLAIFDVIGTIIIAYLIAKFFNLNSFIIIILAFLIGIILHRLFCVNTTINKIIFGQV